MTTAFASAPTFSTERSLPPEIHPALVHQLDAEACIVELQTLTVTTQADLDRLGGVLVDTHAVLVQLEAERTEDTRPELDSLENKRATWSPAINALTSLKGVLKKKIDEGRANLAREAERVLAAAAASGDVQAIAEVMAPTLPKGLTVRHRRMYRVIDESQLPRRFLTINHALLANAIDAGEIVPGVEVTMESKVQPAGRRGKKEGGG